MRKYHLAIEDKKNGGKLNYLVEANTKEEAVERAKNFLARRFSRPVSHTQEQLGALRGDAVAAGFKISHEHSR